LETGAHVERPVQPFFYYTALEPQGIFATTINEMLLHSYRGKIRVFPAIPQDWSGKFQLRAEGAFLVTSEKDVEQPVKYIAVQSLAGMPCTVVNPWERKVNVLDASDGNRKVLETSDRLITFPTQKAHTYIVESVAKPLKSFRVKRLCGVRNKQAKRFEDVSLGKARDF
jgi:alpha-L-fucosidase 2